MLTDSPARIPSGCKSFAFARAPMRALAAAALLLAASAAVPRAQETDKEKYAKRFLDMYEKIKNPQNGYFGSMGLPYHSVETMIIEAPDYGHETTSEAVSYWLWLEGMYGFMTNQWTGVANVWDKAEKYIIPSTQDQPTNSFYKPDKPATFIPEYEDPSQYPAALNDGVAPGQDPIYYELRSTYGNSDVYGMHWLLDVDNWYGFGNRGDGTSKPAYINTFERGASESVWEAIPHPSWDAFKFGGRNGFLDLFVKDSQYSQQWRYTNAPDADARMVQAMYWVALWAKEKGQSPAGVVPVDKAAKMGDFMRYALFDKYFKNLDCAGTTCNPTGNYPNSHYLISWYYGWGGAVDPGKGWAYRIGASHNHFGYQNPVAAYALGKDPLFKPKSQNGASDWAKSFERQMEFYQWLQSAEGGVAGGASSSYQGRYAAKPAGVSQFYGMPYEANPVYLDPGSNTWFGFQAWSMQRMGEIYYISNDPRAEKMMDKWVAWVKKQIFLYDNGSWAIPSTISWTGQPDEWKGFAGFTGNPGLHVHVDNYGTDVGISASVARTLIHYAYAKRKYKGTADAEAIALAKGIIDRMWDKFQDKWGISVPEPRGDYKRMFNQEVFVPSGFSGRMPNGDAIQPGVKFLDIRSKFRQDPAFARVKASIDAGKDPEFRYHRFWAQVEVALAYGEMARFSQDNPNVAPITVLPGSNLNPDYSGTPTNQGDTGNPNKPGDPELPKAPISIVGRYREGNFNVTLSGRNLEVSGPRGAYDLRLFDMRGKEVLKSSGNTGDHARISTAGLKSGVYASRVATPQGELRSMLALP